MFQHLARQLDVAGVGLEDVLRIAAHVAEFEEGDHPRKEEQADDAHKTRGHPFAQTCHHRFQFIFYGKYTNFNPKYPHSGRANRPFHPNGRGRRY